MSSEERDEQIRRFAVALTDTSTRYRGGFMSHPTWKSHMASLWGQVMAAGLRADVMDQVDPALVGVRPVWEQRA